MYLTLFSALLATIIINRHSVVLLRFCSEKNGGAGFDVSVDPGLTVEEKQ